MLSALSIRDAGMARRTTRAALALSATDRASLTELSCSPTAPRRIAARAKVLLLYAAGASITQIQRQVGVSRPTIYKCIDRTLATGVPLGLQDQGPRPRKPRITADAKAWVAATATGKPQDHGFTGERWTLSALTVCIRRQAPGAGFPKLASIGRTTVWRILQQAGRPLSRSSCPLPGNSHRKSRHFLLMCHQLSVQPATSSRDRTAAQHGCRSDSTTALTAVAGGIWHRPPPPGHPDSGPQDDADSKDVLVVVWALDLQSGAIIANVAPSCTSQQCIDLLEDLHGRYPPEATLRIVLDHHPAFVARQTMNHLATRPGRFEYVHMPNQGAWLNLVDIVCVKMLRAVTRDLRATSAVALQSEIERRIAELNEAGVSRRWRQCSLNII